MNYFIGIDGGATKISAGIVRKVDSLTYTLDSEPVAVEIKKCPSFSQEFQPVSIERQLDEYDSGSHQLSIEEERQGIAYAEACELVLSKISELKPIDDLSIGLGMPGMKTGDNQGISVMNNGPRMPRFLDVLNRRLSMAEFPARKIKMLGNDNNYCGLGEVFSENGLLRNIKNGLYIGGGTGIADALVLDGKLVPFESVKNQFKRTWEISNQDSVSIESLISQSGLMNLKAKTTGQSVSELEKNKIFPDSFLGIDEEITSTFLSNLAWLIHHRICTFAGNFKQSMFDRIVLGQRLGIMLNKKPDLLKTVIKNVKAAISDSSNLNQDVKNHYLNSDFIKTSNLIHAPIIGAAVDADRQGS